LPADAKTPEQTPLAERTLKNFLYGQGATKPDLTNNPGDLHFPGTEMDYQKLFGGTKSNQTDQGLPLYQFPSLTQGFAAIAALARKKYQQGKTSLNKLIAGQGGLTPGNASAAANIARSMGIDPNDDLEAIRKKCGHSREHMQRRKAPRMR